MMGPARRGREKGGTTAEPPTQEKASRGEGRGDSSRVYLVTIIVLHSPVGHRGEDNSYLT